MQSASASTQPSSRVPPPVATMRAGVTGLGVDHAPGRERGRLERGAARGRGPCVRSRSTSCPRRSGSCSGTRSPRGYGTHTGTRAGSTGSLPSPSSARRPVEEQPARVARAADEEGAAARCWASRSGSGRSTASGTTAHTISVVPRITSTSPTSPASGDELLGERVDRAAFEHAAGTPDHLAERLPGRVERPATARHARRTTRAARRPIRRSSRTRAPRSPRRSSRSPASPVSAWFATAWAIQ